MSDEWIFDPGMQIEGFTAAGGSSTVGHRNRDRGKHCRGAGNTCAGFKAKGTDYCVGHLRSLGLLKPKKDEAKP